MTLFLNEEMKSQNNRSNYLILFCSVLILTVIITLCVYYLVRYKKKYYFDAAGRKFIVSNGEHSKLILNTMEIIQFDNKKLLEEAVIKNSIGLIHLKNEYNQNLLHICALNGARDCLFYIINFDIINLNDKDSFSETPLTYLLNKFPENTKRNKEMFLWVCSRTNMNGITSDGKIVKEILNDWQLHIYDKYVKNTYVRKYIISTDQSI